MNQRFISFSVNTSQMIKRHFVYCSAYRPNKVLFNLFCLVWIALSGCSTPSFFEKYALRDEKVGVELHSSNSFPPSLSFESPNKTLLIAGEREGFSCFVEYYELQNQEQIKAEEPTGEDWQRLSTRLFLKQRDFLLDQTAFYETYIFFSEDTYVLYGHFLGEEPQEIKKLFPALFKN